MFHKIYLETVWQFKNDVIYVSCILVYCTGRLSYSLCQHLQMFSHRSHFSMKQPKTSDESDCSSELKYSHLNKEPRGNLVFEQCMQKLHIMTNIHQQFDHFLLPFGMKVHEWNKKYQLWNCLWLVLHLSLLCNLIN